MSQHFSFNIKNNKKKTSNLNIPVILAAPLNVISSIIVGSERPLALTANKIMRYELPGSKLSIKNATGGR